MRFARTVLVTAAFAAAAAPTASARVAEERPATTAAGESTFVVTPVRSQDTGFDLSSGLIGASVPLVLLLGGALAAPAVARRRRRHSALAS